MSLGNLSFLIILFSSFSQRVWCARHPNIFVPVSNATCLSEYNWMNNAEQQSVCLTVAYVIAACVGDTWTQPALPSGYSYDSPNGTTATPCYCSWSCYNLMMACTLCQNSASSSDITTWPSFSQNCPSNYKDVVFPPGYVLAGNASIPYWATTNPANWTSELFSITEAQTYANEDKPDYWPSVSTPSSGSSSSGSGSSADVGAIIGGTVGGAAVFLFILIGGIFLYKRRQSRRQRHAEGIQQLPTPLLSGHTRWASDLSSLFSHSMRGPSPPMPYMTPQPQSMGAGMNIPQHAMYSHFQGTSAPTENTSFLTTDNTVLQRTRSIPMV